MVGVLATGDCGQILTDYIKLTVYRDSFLYTFDIQRFYFCRYDSHFCFPLCQIPVVQLPSPVSLSGRVQQLCLPQCRLHSQLPEAAVDSVLGPSAGERRHQSLQVHFLKTVFCAVSVNSSQNPARCRSSDSMISDCLFLILLTAQNRWNTIEWGDESKQQPTGGC